MEPTEAADEISKKFLTVDELISLRKPPELLVAQPIGDKLYFPTKTWIEEKQLDCCLQELKILLEEKRVARRGDLVPAVWNAVLKKAVTRKLKGRFIHHMGHFENGAITLNPEETIFLLESGNIEVFYGGMPLSTEEAYAVVLSGELAVEKYQVYGFLSRLGYLVVGHQEKLDVTSYEQKINLNNVKNSKKRKLGGAVGSRKKSLNFRGAFAKPSNEDIISQEDNIPSSLSNNFTDTANKSCEKENDDFLEPEKVDLNCESNEPNGTFKENSTTLRNVATPVKYDTILSASLPPLNDDNETADKSQDSNDSNLEINVTDSNSPRKNFEENSIGEKRIEVDNNTDEINVDSADDSLINDRLQNKDVIIDPTINVAEATTFRESDNSSDVLLIDESSDDSDSDSSGSSDSQTEDRDGSEADSKQSCNDITDASKSRVPDDSEVVFIEVKKIESEPLAVIDLRFDNESENDSSEAGNSKSESSEDDDDIQIIEETSTPRSATRKANVDNLIDSRGQNSARRNSNLVKKEERQSPSLRQFQFNNRSQRWLFPNIAGKNFICLARPPPHLLPANVRLAKEAYPIDLVMLRHQPEIPTRVWNSYKDLQRRQQPRYDGGRHQEYNHRGDFPRSRPTNHFPYSSDASLWQSPLNSFNDDRDHGLDNINFSNNPEMRMSPTSLLNGPLGLGLGQPPMMGNISTPYLNSGVPDYMMAAQRTTMQIANTMLASIMTQQLNSLRLFNYQSYQSPMAPLTATNNFSPLHQNMFPMIERAKPGSSPLPNVGRNSNYTFRREPSNNSNEHRTVHSNRLSEQDPVRDSDFPPHLTHYQDNESGHLNHERHQGTGPREEENRRSFGQDQWNPNSQYDSRPSRPFEYHRYHRNNFRRQRHFYRNRNRFDQPPFPSSIPKLPIAASSWKDYKSTQPESTSDEIVEVPINVDEILWSKDISPLIKPGFEYPVADVLRKLNITKTANLVTGLNISDRYLPTTCSLEITFDVYLPGTNYRKTCPTIPNHRIVVVRSTDPFPKMSEMVLLQQKFKDSAILQFAVVDNGDVAFYSFNNVSLPTLLPDLC